MFSDKDSNYQAKVGVEHNGDYMFFDDTKFTPESMANFMRSMMTVTDELTSGTVMSNSLFATAYGFHMYSAATGFSKLSQKLPIPSEGMRLVLDFAGLITDANISVFGGGTGGVTGVTLENAAGTSLSCIQASAAGFVEMICTTDGTWSIVTTNASVSVQALA